MMNEKMFKEMHFIMTTIELILDDFCDYTIEKYKEKPLIVIDCLDMADSTYDKIFNELEKMCSYYDNVDFMGCYMFEFNTFNLLLS